MLLVSIRFQEITQARSDACYYPEVIQVVDDFILCDVMNYTKSLSDLETDAIGASFSEHHEASGGSQVGRLIIQSDEQ
jgi:hypothetical protein